MISAGTGELIKRIESERECPYPDVMFGDSRDQALKLKTMKYNDGWTSKCGWFVSPYIADESVLLVNTDLFGYW